MAETTTSTGTPANGDTAQPAVDLQQEIQRTRPDYVVYVPKSWDGSTFDTGNEHFLVFDGPDNSLMAVWTQSSFEGAGDHRIMFSRSADRPHLECASADRRSRQSGRSETAGELGLSAGVPKRPDLHSVQPAYRRHRLPSPAHRRHGRSLQRRQRRQLERAGNGGNAEIAKL